MYLVLAPAVSQNTTINYQSVGREIITVSSLKALETVPDKSEVLVFFDHSLDLQKMLDLTYLLDLQFKIVVRCKEDAELFEGIFQIYIVDYKTIDGNLIRAIKQEDEIALKALNRNVNDRQNIANKMSYLKEVDSIIKMPTSSTAVKELGLTYKNLYSEFIAVRDRLISSEKENIMMKKELASLRISVKKFSLDMKSFIQYFGNLQNKYRAITALTIMKDENILTLPQNIISLFIKDYGIPNVFPFLNSLYDCLTAFHKKYVKVVYICEPDGIAINLLPSKYVLINNIVSQSDILSSDFLCCIGNVDIPIQFLFSSSVLNTIILVDARRTQDILFHGETMFLNLAPDYHTAQALELPEDLTITTSRRSKYRLTEDVLGDGTSYRSRNSKLINDIINTLLDKRGEIG